MPKQRLDQALVKLGAVVTRSQAESYIKLGKVTVNSKIETKAETIVYDQAVIKLTATEQYVSRAGLKLASIAQTLKLDFRDKIVLDVGSSTGGFTDYALQHGAALVLAVELGSNQLHPSLHGNTRIELHEKTDIRNFKTDKVINIVVADVSFVSLRELLPSIAKMVTPAAQLALMVKPQFEAGTSTLKHKGIIKNDKIRRQILKDFEDWALRSFAILDKADSQVAGAKGNRERFYLLRKL